MAQLSSLSILRGAVRNGLLSTCVIVAALLTGCNRTPPAVVPAKPPDVSFTYPVQQNVRDYEDYTGRTESIPKVEIRSRVTGELTKILFTDGTLVTKGKPLFEIDPRPFEAVVSAMTAIVHQSEGDLKRKKILLDRARDLRARGSNSQEDLDNALADFDVGKASLELAEANKKTADLNLAFCFINSPIDGLISRTNIDVGNQVMANVTPLTTVDSLDPIYANFDVDERTLLRLRRLLIKGEINSARTNKTKLDIGLADEVGFSIHGIIDFADNSLDSGTGTLRVRVQIDNPEINGRRLLSQNMFVRIRFWIGEANPSLLVPESALVSDQGIRHLFVVKDSVNQKTRQAEQVVEYRPVEIGLQHGDMRVIKSGLSANDRVLVGGLQRVRAGIPVTATQVKTKKQNLPDEKTNAVSNASK